MKTTFSGMRDDLDNLFKLSGIDCKGYRNRQHPFLALTPTQEGVKIEVMESLAQVLRLPDSTEILVQWPGRWSSDFFHLTVGELRVSAEARVAAGSTPRC
jgi:hypothetical protein